MTESDTTYEDEVAALMAFADGDDSSAGGAETVVGHQLLVRGSSVPA